VKPPAPWFPSAGPTRDTTALIKPKGSENTSTRVSEPFIAFVCLTYLRNWSSMKITTSHYQHPQKTCWRRSFLFGLLFFHTTFLGYIPLCRFTLRTLAGIVISGCPLMPTPQALQFGQSNLRHSHKVTFKEIFVKGHLAISRKYSLKLPNTILASFHLSLLPLPLNFRRLLISRDRERIKRIFLNFRETQEFLDISHETLYRLMKQGLPSHRIGRKRVFLIKDLIRWIEEH